MREAQAMHLGGAQNLNRNSAVYYIQDVGVDFGGIKALSSIELSIKPGEIIFVTGASGAGKTTLLNILAGDLRPSKGRIISAPFENSNQFVSRVFQDLRLMPHLSCLDNLRFAFDPTLHKTKKQFEQELKELCQVLEITHLLKVKIKDANGGLKQKVAMIRALLSRPTVLLADEPTCAMDKVNARRLFEVVNFYNSKKKLTVIWATHDKDLISQFPGRIIHLDKGKLVYSGHACFI